ncbi:MAG: hypothetical protein IKC48_03825 [Clostridia bacterium]|nr:hypothetical protein [Clostridia bacterium]
MSTKAKSLLMSSLMVMMCLAAVAVGTYALFSAEVTLTNHLKAGTLDVMLRRTNLVATYLDEDGYLDEKTDGEDVDFTQATNQNVFGFSGTGTVVPGSKYTADMEIINNGDVAFAYWIEIVFDDTLGLELADQIEITVTTDQSVSAKLSSGVTLGSETSPIGTLAATDESQAFSVSVEFLDLKDGSNNDAQGQEVSFDLVVHAVQVVSQ